MQTYAKGSPVHCLVRRSWLAGGATQTALSSLGDALPVSMASKASFENGGSLRTVARKNGILNYEYKALVIT